MWNKAFCIFLLALMAIFISCTSNNNIKPKAERKPGQFLYEKNCSICHGDDGKKGLSGAKDLSISTLNPAEQKLIITNGKGGMAGFKGRLSEEEIDQIVVFIQTFKSAK